MFSLFTTTLRMLTFNDKGIYCAKAAVYVDPWQPVERAIITHAHADHARPGSKHYLCHELTAPLLRLRLGEAISVQTLTYGETITLNGVSVSLHPAGHIIGSAQVRLAYKGEVWVISGDYKMQDDGLSTPFEPVRCHHFITESTFGLPIYKFPPQDEVKRDMNNWIAKNREDGINSLLVGYALGKAQRIIEMIDFPDQTIYAHGAVANIQQRFIDSNVSLRPVVPAIQANIKAKEHAGIIVMPPSAIGTPWLKRFSPYKVGFFSGWMQLRGARRRRNADRGFVLSDHADWMQLNAAILATQAQHIYVTHGYKAIYAKWLRENYQLDAVEVDTLYDDELLNGEGSDETL